MSSSFSCGINETNVKSNIGLFSGNIVVSNVNETNNKLFQFAGFSFQTGSSNAVSSFCNLCDNNMDDILFGSFNRDPQLKTALKLTNIINNKKSGTAYGLIYTWYSSDIENCSIFQNEGKPIFCVHYSGYTMTVSNCFYDSNSTTQQGTVDFVKSQSSSFIVNFEVLETNYFQNINHKCIKTHIKIKGTCFEKHDNYLYANIVRPMNAILFVEVKI